jgi:hypothetical protein
VIALGNFEGTFCRYAKAVELQHGEAWKASEEGSAAGLLEGEALEAETA